jgi:transcriptional regulator with XRE-family HTH domain
MKPNNKSSLEKILEEITPEQQARTDVKMLLAARIADAMEAKGWNNKMLMEALGKKNPSEITRWLSGTHNFTVDTLADLGRVLERDFINLSPEKEQPVQQFNISVLTYSGPSWYSPSVVNETDESSTYHEMNEKIYLI